MLLQEYKLRKDRANNLGLIMWRETFNWTIETSPRYSINDPNSRAKKGGVNSFVARKWGKLVT
jgi:hypothetical protein